MKILLTGYKGFIGKNMLPVLRREGHTVYTYEWGEDFSFDIVSHCDWVIHLGAISTTTEKDVRKIYKQNIEFTFDLYEKCCIENNVRMQFASSASVYGQGPVFSEDAHPKPQTLYATSKLFSEEDLKNDAQCFRYFNVYGPNEEHKEQPSPYTSFAKQAKENGCIKIFEGSENMRRDFIHVDDVIRYHLQFFNVKENGIFNIGTGKAKSFLDVAKEVSIQHGNVPIIEVPMPDNLKRFYQYYTCADMTKTNAVLHK